ncbi:MAG: hypothetical protein ACXW0Q_06820 [Methylovulum sp.]
MIAIISALIAENYLILSVAYKKMKVYCLDGLYGQAMPLKAYKESLPK